MAADGSLSHPIRLPGRDDEFRELADASTPCWGSSKRVSRTAEVCSQCVARTAHAPRDHADTPGGRPKRSKSRHDELMDASSL